MIRVVIPAYDSAATLPTCVESVMAATTGMDWELLIADDGKNGDLAKLLAPYPVTITDGAKVGNAGLTRNKGAQGFTGDIIVFVDADVRVEKESISRLIQPIIDGQADATVGNYSENVTGMSFAQKYKQLYLVLVYSRMPGYIKDQFWTALGAVSTKAFEDLCGFGEKFPGACGEDTDIGIRMTAKGMKIMSVPSAAGQHLKELTCEKIIRNDWKKGINTAYLIFKSSVTLSENRHSSKKDISAVFFSYLTLLVLLVGLFGLLGKAGIMLLAASFGAYIYSRFDLISIFSKQGPLFGLASFGFMYFLDLLRGQCLIFGSTKALVERVSSQKG